MWMAKKHMYNWQYGAFERSLANDADIAKFRFWLVTVDCRFIRLNVFWLVTVDFLTCLNVFWLVVVDCK